MMVSSAFTKLKQSKADNLQRLRHSLGFKSGSHKRKRLVLAVGGKLAKRTILDSATQKQHQEKLFVRFRKAWSVLTDQQARERLRFVTILHTVCAVETEAILRAVEEMEAQLRTALSNEIKQIGILGVSEVEMVSLSLYGKEDAEDEARKGQVLRQMAQATGMKGAGTVFTRMTGEEHLALVHFHGIIDLGSQAAITETKLQNVLRQTWKGSWCVELKRLFATQSVVKSLRRIAGYLTKGGNDTLRFRKQFGSEAPEALELAMAKEGYAESGEYNDHLGLSVGEVSVLVNVYDALMDRNSTREGYLFLGGTVIHNRHQAPRQYRVWKSALGISPFRHPSY
ncbi:hypothetical protein AYO43_08585 [Nitrospira sp. SCGC AG-212-E16]|nr:hypothetical protein AYO43_08585 [Nitrospira sp. SCGC AG-212-E16]